MPIDLYALGELEGFALDAPGEPDGDSGMTRGQLASLEAFALNEPQDIPSASGNIEGLKGIGQGLKAAMPFSTAISPVELAPNPTTPGSGVAEGLQSLSRNAIPTVGGAIAGGVAGAGTGGVTVPVVGAIPGAVLGAAGGAATGGAISEGMEIQREERIRQLRAEQAGDSFAGDEGIDVFQPDALKSGAAAARIAGRGVVDAVTVGAGTAASRAGYGILKELAVTAPLDLAGGGAQAAATIIEQGMRDGQSLEEIVGSEDFLGTLAKAGVSEAALGSMMSAAPVVARKLREADVFGMASRNAHGASESRLTGEPGPIPASGAENAVADVEAVSAAGVDDGFDVVDVIGGRAVQPDSGPMVDQPQSDVVPVEYSPEAEAQVGLRPGADVAPKERIFDPLPGQGEGRQKTSSDVINDAEDPANIQPSDIRATLEDSPTVEDIAVASGEPAPVRQPSDIATGLRQDATPDVPRETPEIEELTPKLVSEDFEGAAAPRSVSQGPDVRAVPGATPGDRTKILGGGRTTLGGVLDEIRGGRKFLLDDQSRGELANVIDTLGPKRAKQIFTENPKEGGSLGDVDIADLRSRSTAFADLPEDGDINDVIAALDRISREGGTRFQSAAARDDFGDVHVGDADAAMADLAEARDLGRALPVADFNEAIGRARGIGDAETGKAGSIAASKLPDGQELEIGGAKFKVERAESGDIELVPQGGDASLFPRVQAGPDDVVTVDRAPKGFKARKAPTQLAGDISRSDLAQIAKKAESAQSGAEVEDAVASIKNANMKAVRDRIEELNDPLREDTKTFEQAFEGAKAEGLDREDRVDVLLEDILTKPRFMTMEETAGVVLSRARAEAEFDLWNARMKNKGLSESARIDAAARREHALGRLQLISDALAKNGTDIARALSVRRLAVKQDAAGEFSLADIEIQVKAKRGGEVTGADRKFIDRLEREFEKLEERFATAQEELETIQAENAMQAMALASRADAPTGGKGGKGGKKAKAKAREAVESDLAKLEELLKSGCKLFEPDKDTLN